MRRAGQQTVCTHKIISPPKLIHLAGGADYHDPATTTTAVAGTKNAQYFYTNGVCAALDWDFNVFYFEAFAEPWKPDSKGVSGDYRDEKHWGAFDASGVPILDLSCKYKEL